LKKHDCNFFYGKTIITDLRDGSAKMKYCPLCGNILGMNEALTIEELTKQNEKPVYVTCEEFPNLDGWYIVHIDKQTKRVECWGYDSTKMDSINYGAWLAYLNKP
jgi:hypothetical protein